MPFYDYVYYIMKHVLEWTIINNLWANFLLSISSFVCLYFLAHINRNIWVNKFLAKGDWKGINLSYLHDVNTKNVLMPLGYLPEKMARRCWFPSHRTCSTFHFFSSGFSFEFEIEFFFSDWLGKKTIFVWLPRYL